VSICTELLPPGGYPTTVNKYIIPYKMDVSGQLHAPVTLPPGVTPYPLNVRLGEPQYRAGQPEEEKPQSDILTHKSSLLCPLYKVVLHMFGSTKYQLQRIFLETVDVPGQANITAATYSTV
jgi:hypothetical protein